MDCIYYIFLCWHNSVDTLRKKREKKNGTHETYQPRIFLIPYLRMSVIYDTHRHSHRTNDKEMRKITSLQKNVRCEGFALRFPVFICFLRSQFSFFSPLHFNFHFFSSIRFFFCCCSVQRSVLFPSLEMFRCRLIFQDSFLFSLQFLLHLLIFGAVVSCTFGALYISEASLYIFFLCDSLSLILYGIYSDGICASRLFFFARAWFVLEVECSSIVLCACFISNWMTDCDFYRNRYRFK